MFYSLFSLILFCLFFFFVCIFCIVYFAFGLFFFCFSSVRSSSSCFRILLVFVVVFVGFFK